MIAAEQHPVEVACRVLGVAESGFYEQRRRAPSQRAVRHVMLADLITQVHSESGGTYGSSRVCAELTLGRRPDRQHLGPAPREAYAAATGVLADPTDLRFDPAHLDQDGLSDRAEIEQAVAFLLDSTPHLASRIPRDDVGHGARDDSVDVRLAERLRAGAPPIPASQGRDSVTRMALPSPGLRKWSRQHPLMDGAMLGPLLAVALLVLRWNGWIAVPYVWVLVAALAGVGFGVFMGTRRKRRIDSTRPEGPRGSGVDDVTSRVR